MVDSKAVESYLYNLFSEKYNRKMEEMRMQKLMYFSQRESMIVRRKPLFDEKIYAWKYGPVLYSVIDEYKKERPYLTECYNFGKEKELLHDVMRRYGPMSLWGLSSLTHAEFSWRRARKGLAPGENGNAVIGLNAIRADAAREKSFRDAIDRLAICL